MPFNLIYLYSVIFVKQKRLLEMPQLHPVSKNKNVNFIQTWKFFMKIARKMSFSSSLNSYITDIESISVISLLLILLALTKHYIYYVIHSEIEVPNRNQFLGVYYLIKPGNCIISVGRLDMCVVLCINYTNK